MKCAPLLTSLGLACAFSLTSFAAEPYKAPRTEWGQPDLQGVWNFSSNTPMQRPERFGERQFLTEEEIIQAQAAREARDASSDAAIAMELGKQRKRNEYGGVYGELYRRYRIPSYRELPAANFDDAIAWLGEWLETLTGDTPF